MIDWESISDAEEDGTDVAATKVVPTFAETLDGDESALGILAFFEKKFPVGAIFMGLGPSQNLRCEQKVGARISNIVLTHDEWIYP
ncbi:hypothetical protein INT47_001872 [Mucor saturninus]|uniref:Uncharacterized protein n=1 Tax=Mucor saturninus TaxID=64648 RepID=A0A8H7REK1_9FUNG|nr:hypothetical protein INT47_001872 [Mucor saturninus]